MGDAYPKNDKETKGVGHAPTRQFPAFLGSGAELTVLIQGGKVTDSAAQPSTCTAWPRTQGPSPRVVFQAP
jgi:hypothetical protein